MSSEQDKKMNPNPEELQELEDKKLDTVAGGLWGNTQAEGICSVVRRMVAEAAEKCYVAGKSRDDCGIWIDMHLYKDLCEINEANGYEYMIDWQYLNQVIDERYDRNDIVGGGIEGPGIILP